MCITICILAIDHSITSFMWVGLDDLQREVQNAGWSAQTPNCREKKSFSENEAAKPQFSGVAERQARPSLPMTVS